MARRKAEPPLPGGALGAADHIAPDKLLLDYENPRLAAFIEENPRATQSEILEHLWDADAVEEVALSIAANGYFPHEPLLAIPHPKENQHFVVIEGNRRLAAIKILLDNHLREKLGATDSAEASSSRITELKEGIPCRIYPDRKNVWAYVGFRHIHGVRPWDALSKAKYAVMIHQQYRVPLDEIARRIGDRHATIERFYRGYMVLQQAETQAGYSLKDCFSKRFAFSHLYTGLDSKEFKKFLGLPEGASPNKSNPVPKSKMNNLQELMTWLYGSRERKIAPVIRSQNPDLWRLATVVSKPPALALLRRTRNLDQASEVAKGNEERFKEAIFLARENLQVARGASLGFKGSPEILKALEEIVTISASLQEELLAREAKNVVR